MRPVEHRLQFQLLIGIGIVDLGRECRLHGRFIFERVLVVQLRRIQLELLGFELIQLQLFRIEHLLLGGFDQLLQLAATASDGRALGLALNPRGGAYLGAAEVPGGVTEGGVDLLPPGTASLSDPTQAILVGLYAPDPTTPTSYTLGWMMTGGSSDPVDLLLIAY